MVAVEETLERRKGIRGLTGGERWEVIKVCDSRITIAPEWRLTKRGRAGQGGRYLNRHAYVVLTLFVTEIGQEGRMGGSESEGGERDREGVNQGEASESEGGDE